MNKETESVINFLKENPQVISSLYEKVKGKPSYLLSYSGLLQTEKLDGTTRDGVNFKSSKIQRALVSEYIRSRVGE